LGDLPSEPATCLSPPLQATFDVVLSSLSNSHLYCTYCSTGWLLL
jgi:hypothetical protein